MSDTYPIYEITRKMGVRWYDFPYEVVREDKYGGKYVGNASTKLGARMLIKRDKRELAGGTRVVYKGS